MIQDASVRYDGENLRFVIAKVSDGEYTLEPVEPVWLMAVLRREGTGVEEDKDDHKPVEGL